MTRPASFLGEVAGKRRTARRGGAGLGHERNARDNGNAEPAKDAKGAGEARERGGGRGFDTGVFLKGAGEDGDDGGERGCRGEAGVLECRAFQGGQAALDLERVQPFGEGHHGEAVPGGELGEGEG